MPTPAFDTNYNPEIDKVFFKHHLNEAIKYSHEQFKKELKSYTQFNLLFFLVILVEVSYFFIHLTFLVQNFTMAIHLALIFATVFCYFTLRMYAQTRKIEKLIQVKTDFLQRCRHTNELVDEVAEHHQLLAEACCRFAADLHRLEYHIYPCPNWCSFLSSSVEKINCWWFWSDIHFMKEFLLKECVEEHIKIVRLEPTDLEAHAGLANAYVMLSGLYIDPRTVDGLDEDRWIPPSKFDESFKNQFRLVAERAIEEFKILSDYAPHDPWVHAQLAYSYHDLQMPEEEIKEYETIINLCPEDRDSLFKLGKLYFEHGANAKGLQIYETLKESNYKKAEDLIHFYGSYSKLSY